MEDVTSIPTSTLNIFWMLVAAALVMIMQGGFCFLESGLVRSKNSINVAIKNLIDFVVAALIFWAVGFGLMFGDSFNGHIGSSMFFINADGNPWLLAFFLFQFVFCGTATTIISGAVAERMRFLGYLCIAVFVSGLIYPVFGHWAWGGIVPGTGQGWLAARGFIDFAGSTVVHSVGGWVSLAAVLVIGPRIGRFAGKQRQLSGHNLPMATLGVMLLWFGWFGFNGGSTLAINDQLPLILVNTNLSAAAGAVACLLYSYLTRRLPDVGLVMNGTIAGLVAITAGCHLMTPITSLIVGGVAGFLCGAMTDALNRLRIDDAIGAVPAHGVAGVWGTLAVALMGSPAMFGEGMTRWDQFAVQLTGAGVCFAWSMGVCLPVFYLIHHHLCSLRVTPEEERIGLNMSEHGVSTELIDLLTEMDGQRRSGDFTRHVTVEPNTEVGQIAAQYNRVLERVNIESRKQMEALQAVEQAKHQTEKLLGSISSILIGLDGDQVITQWNRVAEDTFGIASRNALGRPLKDCGIQWDLDTIQSAIEDCHKVNLPARIREMEFRRPDGDCGYLGITVNPVLDGGDDGRGCLLLGMEITHQKKLEDQLNQSQKMEAIGTLAGGVAHDFNNMLASILGYSTMLKRPTSSPEQVLKAASVIEQAARRASQLTQQLLGFARRGKLIKEKTDINKMIREVVELLLHTIDKNIEINAAMSVEEAFVLGDPSQLQSVLMNLGVNARDAMPNGGKLTFTSRLTHLNRSHLKDFKDMKPGDYVVIEITDTGVGIPKNIQNRIFDPFFTTKEPGKGTGMGLAMVYGIISNHGGFVRLYSEVSFGTTFRIYLPVHQIRTRDLPQMLEPQELRRGSECILVVDDEELIREFARDLLSELGYKVLTANDGAEALELFREHALHIDLVILDMIMPKMGGKECFEQLKCMRHDVKAILATGYGRDGQAQEILDTGIQGYIQKPFEMEDLSRTIGQLLTPDHHSR